MAKSLLIRTNELEPYLQLGWWNIDNIPDLDNLKYIFAHDGKGNVTGAYEIKTKSWDNGADDWGEIILPYALKIDYKHKLDKNGNPIKVYTKRVNFYEYVNIREDLKSVKTPMQKQGQGYPLQVIDFDETTKTIITNQTKQIRRQYDWSKNFKSGDVLWFYMVDSKFSIKNYIPIKMIIDDPVKRSIIVNGIKFASVNNYVTTALSSFIKISPTDNKPMNINCLGWVISDREKQNVDVLMKNNPDNINIRTYITKHSSTELGEDFI